MSSPDHAVIQQRLTDLLDLHLKHLRRGRDELHARRLSPDKVEGVLLGTAMLAVDYATAALGLLLTDFNDLAARMIAETEPDTAEVEIPTDPHEAAEWRRNAARLLAGAWVASQLTANVPPRAWPEDFPLLCLTVAARAQVQHEIDEDLDHLGEDQGGTDDAGGRR
ncbi:hypothetical protein [Actinokineospora sp.]|uniref:hypothetical protein n=1 Tax=Actinokineospora sp. TaxID=1872133 RepID=UPI003D6A29EA